MRVSQSVTSGKLDKPQATIDSKQHILTELPGQRSSHKREVD